MTTYACTTERKRVRDVLRALREPAVFALTSDARYIANLVNARLLSNGVVIGGVGRSMSRLTYVDEPDVYLLMGVVRSMMAEIGSRDLFLFADVDNPFDEQEVAEAFAIATVYAKKIVGVGVFGNGASALLSGFVVQHL